MGFYGAQELLLLNEICGLLVWARAAACKSCGAGSGEGIEPGAMSSEKLLFCPTQTIDHRPLLQNRADESIKGPGCIDMSTACMNY